MFCLILSVYCADLGDDSQSAYLDLGVTLRSFEQTGKVSDITSFTEEEDDTEALI